MKKRQFGHHEQLIIEAEIARLCNRSGQSELSLEDVKKLDLLIKTKKIILEREDEQEPTDVTPAKQLPTEALLELAEGIDVEQTTDEN